MALNVLITVLLHPPQSLNVEILTLLPTNACKHHFKTVYNVLELINAANVIIILI